MIVYTIRMYNTYNNCTFSFHQMLCFDSFSHRFLNRPTPRPKELSSEILETLLNGIPFSSDSFPQSRNSDKDTKSGKSNKNPGSNNSAHSNPTTNINRELLKIYFFCKILFFFLPILVQSKNSYSIKNFGV